MVRRVHLLQDEQPGPLYVAACKWAFGNANRLTQVPDDVTCLLCKDAIISPDPTPIRTWYTPTGEPEAEPRQIKWQNWRHALRHWVQRLDDGAPVKSNGNPSRFEGFLDGFRIHAEGDAGQRQAELLAPISAAIGTIPVEVSGLPKHQAFELTVAHVCGMPRESRTGPKIAQRKQVLIQRYPESVQVLAAEASKFLPQPITVGHVLQVVSVVGSYIQSHLHSKRLLLHTEETHTLPKIGEYNLEGWQQISDALGVDTTTAYRYASRDVNPLPVRKMSRNVIASSKELEAWIRQEARPFKKP